jgi:cytochrome P450
MINGQPERQIPEELIQRLDMLSSAGAIGDPYDMVDKMVAGPPIFYTPTQHSLGEGAWVLTRARDIRRVLMDPDGFSNKGIVGLSSLIGESWKLILTENDAPIHTRYRGVAVPMLLPQRVRELRPKIRKIAKDIIEDIAKTDNCDFVDSFSSLFPIKIFLDLMDLPMSDASEFLEWEKRILHSKDLTDRIEGTRWIAGYLRQIISDRRKTPGDDLISLILAARISSEPMTEDEVLGLAFQFYVGGLDTVPSMLGYQFRHLAMNPVHQEQLRQYPDKIPDAVEEMLRAFSIVSTNRVATKNTEIAGVEIKAGDVVICGTMVGNRDPEAVACPHMIDFERKKNQHMAFGLGRHSCIGAPLARAELVIAIEEWLKCIPSFQLDTGKPAVLGQGFVFTVTSLPLRWENN